MIARSGRQSIGERLINGLVLVVFAVLAAAFVVSVLKSIIVWLVAIAAMVALFAIIWRHFRRW